MFCQPKNEKVSLHRNLCLLEIKENVSLLCVCTGIINRGLLGKINISTNDLSLHNTCLNLLSILALTLGFLPSALMNGGFLKGFVKSSSSTLLISVNAAFSVKYIRFFL